MKIDINTPGKMVAAAKLQGIELSAAEADAILGCLEAHDY